VPSRTRRTALPATWAGVVLALSACGGTGDLPVPLADSPACRASLAAAPAAVLDRSAVAVDGAAVRAWGQPPVVVRCGLSEPAPTTTGCLTVDDVDWVVDPSTDPITAITFGRSPALEVRVPASLGKEVVPAALVDLAPMAVTLPRTAHACVG